MAGVCGNQLHLKQNQPDAGWTYCEFEKKRKKTKKTTTKQKPNSQISVHNGIHSCAPIHPNMSAQSSL